MQNLRHHSLVAWQRADYLFIKLHPLTTKRFPAFERFEIGGQLRRAAYSVPANIVEGFACRYRRKRLHFLNIAEASLAEVGYASTQPIVWATSQTKWRRTWRKTSAQLVLLSWVSSARPARWPSTR
jgi:hypothetical protein